jgi:hypothetical protein
MRSQICQLSAEEIPKTDPRSLRASIARSEQDGA